MIIGQTIFVDGEPVISYYSPWFARRGNAAVFVCDVIQTADVNSFDVGVETKASEESDGSAVALASEPITLTANTRTSFEVGSGLAGAGFKDLVRFRYDLAWNGSGVDLGYLHFRMLNPAWLTD